jgi:hypothetical protein
MWWWFLGACASNPAPCEGGCGPVSDADGDGYLSVQMGGADCDDADADLNPADADGDGWSTCSGDCDDAAMDRGPRVVTPEACDDVDNDCNGVVDVDDLGVSACAVSVAFDRPARVQLDLLLVLDDTGGMTEEQDRLAAARAAATAILVGTDSHVGVTTNDASTVATAGHLRASFGGDRWLSALEVDSATADAWWRLTTDVGASGQHDDAGFDAAMAAITDSDGFNTGFLRAEAGLVVLFVADAEDGSRVTSAEELAEQLAAAKAGGAAEARAYAIAPRPGAACPLETSAATYRAAADATGGEVYALCEEDWSAALTSLLTRERPTTQITLPLPDVPIPVTLAVALEGLDGRWTALPADALAYDPFLQQVVVSGWTWLDAVSVEVTYEVLPPNASP